jgi:hypothetical protein
MSVLDNWKNYWLLTRASALLSLYKFRNPNKDIRDKWGIHDDHNAMYADEAQRKFSFIPHGKTPLECEEQRFVHTIKVMKELFNKTDIIEVDSHIYGVFLVIKTMEADFKEYTKLKMEIIKSSSSQVAEPEVQKPDSDPKSLPASNLH